MPNSTGGPARGRGARQTGGIRQLHPVPTTICPARTTSYKRRRHIRPHPRRHQAMPRLGNSARAPL